MALIGKVVVVSPDRSKEEVKAILPVKMEEYEGPYLFIDGRRKKLSRASAYILDMLTRE